MLEKFFQKYTIDGNSILVIACSGGSDSMFLLSEIMKIHPRERIVVAHFNHCLREMESDGDEEFLRDFCRERSLVFESTKKNIAGIAQEQKK